MNGIEKMHLIATSQVLKEEFKAKGVSFTDLQVEVFATLQLLIASETAYQIQTNGREFNDKLCYFSTVKVVEDIIKEYQDNGDWKRFGAAYMYIGAMGLGGSF